MSKVYKVQGVAQLLDTTVDSVRRYIDEAGMEIQRAEKGAKTRLLTVENVYDLAAYKASKKKQLSKNPKKIITIWTPKGGVGKSTIAFNLSALFSLMGLKVLVIDLDFQSNLTLAFGYDSELSLEEAEASNISSGQVVEYHFGHLMPSWPQGRVSLNKVLKKPFGENGPHLIPSDVTLDYVDAMLTFEALQNQSPDKKIAALFHEGISGRNPDFDLSVYDIILIDAAPAKNRATRGALLASDYVLSPVSMEKFSTKGLSYLSKVLNEIRESFNRAPELCVLGNFFDSSRIRIIKQLATITDHYQDSWLEATIRRSEDFPKLLASEESIPLVLSKPSSDATGDLKKVAKALVDKMGYAS